MRHRFPKGPKHPGWKGGITYYKGCKAIRTPRHPYAMKSGYVLESRLVVEKDLGRYLLPYEKVHHINANPTDNRLENLIVLTIKSHTRHHKNPKAKWNLLDNPNWLQDQRKKKMSQEQIAQVIGCSQISVSTFLKRFNLP